jgi:hypothetical protein
MPVPSHLLFLDHPFRDNLIDRRLDKPSRDPLPGAVPLAVVGHGICVQFQITYGLQQHERELFQRWDVLETPRLRPLPKMYQTHDSSLGEAIPKTPLRVLDLSQRMAPKSTIGKAVYALRELLEICEFHRDVEPIQDVVSLWRNLLMNSPQTGIAVGKNCDRSGFVNSAMPERKTDCAHGLRTSVTHEGKAGSLPIAIQRFAGNDLKVSFRSSVSIFEVSTVEADHQFFAGLVRSSSSEDFRRFLKSSAHPHRPITDGTGSCPH